MPPGTPNSGAGACAKAGRRARGYARQRSRWVTSLRFAGHRHPASTKHQGSKCGAVFEAHQGARRFGAASCCRARWSRLRLGGFVVVHLDFLCGAGEAVGQHGGEEPPRKPWIGAVEPVRQTFKYPCPPRDGRLVRAGRRAPSWKSCTPAAPDWMSRRRTPRCESASPGRVSARQQRADDRVAAGEVQLVAHDPGARRRKTGWTSTTAASWPSSATARASRASRSR